MDGLRVEELTKHFGGVQALDGLHLQIAEGERRAIIGPNGSGKTTLYNLISGLLKPSAGRVFLFGQDVTAKRAYERAQMGLGRTFQLINLFPELPIMENVLLGILGYKSCRFGMFRSLHSYPDILDRAEKLLHEWDLWGKRTTPVCDLSYGEQRRLELVVSLASQPRIMLLDEPTAGLSGTEVKDFCAAVRRTGRDITVLIIEHDMDVVFDVADRITVLDHGRVIADGEKDTVRADPRVREVYLGTGE